MAGTYTNTSDVSDRRERTRATTAHAFARKRGASLSHVYNIEHIATPLQSDAATELATLRKPQSVPSSAASACNKLRLKLSHKIKFNTKNVDHEMTSVADGTLGNLKNTK